MKQAQIATGRSSLRGDDDGRIKHQQQQERKRKTNKEKLSQGRVQL